MGTATEHSLEITAPGVALPGVLGVPDAARGLVVFAHGSGSSHRSPRNRMVAAELQRRGLVTLLFDLLSPEEAADRSLVFDIPLLASRLRLAVEAACSNGMGRLPLGLFGASTGAAAALWAAAEPDLGVRAVVSRGGRPDLAAERLPSVQAPTLLIVGSEDTLVLELNRRAAEQLGGERAVEVVPGAGHLFEEPGALEQVARLAGGWFERHLRHSARPSGRD